MSADERTLGERVASMIASAVSADAFYFRELDAVAALLREQQAEIERLAKERDLACKEVDAAQAERDSLRRDLDELASAATALRDHLGYSGDADREALTQKLARFDAAIDLARARGEG